MADELLFEPGEQHVYSNTNYLILGILIEDVTGQPFHAALRSRILEPLTLEGTYLAGHEDGPAPFPAFTATGPIDFDYAALATTGWGSGAIVSSAGDLHELLNAVFDARLISQRSLQAMTAGSGYGVGITRSTRPATSTATLGARTGRFHAGRTRSAHPYHRFLGRHERRGRHLAGVDEILDRMHRT